MSFIIPTEYLQQKATPSQRGSRRVPTGFLQRGRAPSAPLRALSMAVASPTGRRRLIPCPRVIAALLALPPSSGAVVAPPGLPPRGSLRRLAPRAPRVRPGSLRRLGGVLPAPVLLAPCGSRSAPLLAALLIAPLVLGALPPPRGSPQMARQSSPPRLGARPYASPCGLAAPNPPSLREAIAFQRGSRRSRARYARTVRGLPPTPVYIGSENHVLAMLALLVGSRPHPLTSAEKVTCSLCSHCSWVATHTRLHRRVPAVRVASPGLHGSGKALRFTCAPCAPLRSPSWCHARLRSASAVSTRLRRFLSFLPRCAPIGWGEAVPPSSFGLVLAAARFHPLSVLSVPCCRTSYLFGGGGFGSSSRGRRCGRRHGARCPCLPSGGAPTPRPRSPAPFGRALPTVGLRGERLKPFLSATRSQCQTWLVSSTKPQRHGLNRSIGTPQKPCLPFLRHYWHRFCGGA